MKMPFRFLILLLLVPSFALITLIALLTGFYFSNPPNGMASLILFIPYYGNALAIVLTLSAGWLFAAGGGMKSTQLNKSILFVAWFLLMMAMMKVGLHIFELWSGGSVGVSRVALLMGGIVAPISCQVLLLITTFINGVHGQPGNRWQRQTIVPLAALMILSLAIGATTLLIKIT